MSCSIESKARFNLGPLLLLLLTGLLLLLWLTKLWEPNLLLLLMELLLRLLEEP